MNICSSVALHRTYDESRQEPSAQRRYLVIVVRLPAETRRRDGEVRTTCKDTVFYFHTFFMLSPPIIDPFGVDRYKLPYRRIAYTYPKGID